MKNFFFRVFTPLALVTIWIYQFLFSKPWAVIVDAERYNGYQIFVIRYALEHFKQFGLWDQFLSSGMSWISHPGGPLFSPFTWVIIAFTKNITIGSHMLIFFTVLLAALSMYYLLRILGVKPIIAILTCIPYLSNQYVAVLAANGFLEELFALFLIPLTTALLWQSIRKNNFYYALAGGLVMTLHFFQNTYYVFHYNLILLLVVSFALSVLKISENKKQWKKEVISVVFINLVFYVSFIGLSCIKLLPLLEFRELSSRNATPLWMLETPDGVLSFQFFLDRMHYFFFPLGNPLPVKIIFSKITNDLGLLIVLMAIVVSFVKKKWIGVIFSTVFLIGIWGYFANKIPFDLYGFFYYFLPGFSSNQYPYRFFIIIHFAYFILLALGANFVFSQSFWRKVIVLALLCFIGFFTSWYARVFFAEVPFSVSSDFVRNNNTSKAIVPVLSKLVKAHAPEGRVYSTFLSGSNIITSSTALRYEIPLVHHSYEAIVPTYQYGIVIPGSSNDSLEKTKKRYKVFTVLNTVYQAQQNAYFEYEGCFGKPVVSKAPAEGVCNFLESRLTSLFQTNDGGIYFDSKVLPRSALIPHAVLVIGDNRFNDFSGFLAKQIMFHQNFNEHNISIFTSQKTEVADYTLSELAQFDALILVNPKIHKMQLNNTLLQSFVEKGGKVISLHSHWVRYDNLQKRSASIYTENPAWSFSEEDSKNLSELFTVLSGNMPEAGTIVTKKFTPEEMQYKIITKKENTVLQVSDSYFPGWKATVNGKNVPVYMADGLVKGIVLPKRGTYDVKLFYRPDSFIKGALISISTVICIILVYVFYRWRLAVLLA